MTWHQQPESSELEKLGKITVRLIRVMTYEKLARAQAQLRAHGVPTDFLAQFRKHAAQDMEKLRDNEPNTRERETVSKR